MRKRVRAEAERVGSALAHGMRNPFRFLTLLILPNPIVQRWNQRGVQKTRTARAEARKRTAPDRRMAEAPLRGRERASGKLRDKKGRGTHEVEVLLVEVAPAATDESEPVATAPTPPGMTAIPLAGVAPVDPMASALNAAKDCVTVVFSVWTSSE